MNISELTNLNSKLSEYLHENRVLLLFASENLQDILMKTSIIHTEYDDDNHYSTIFFNTKTFHWRLRADKVTRHINIRGGDTSGSNDLSMFDWSIDTSTYARYNKEIFIMEDLTILKKLFEQDDLFKKIFNVTKDKK